ncbi:GNAT family N-acetyltransferase [Chitinophaga vietnamensis]|uniref:GNAT family N-acetyltransferase n=1 Tax=Chitinophaga vietnamensis TaxID=2593957 RepID=UPI001177DFB5|nr:GNAT family N-acetyltransferase [Chitinophaga vietnamensis]
MIELRAARYEDHAAIAALHTASWRHTYRGIYSDHYLDNDAAAERAAVWQQRLQQPAANQWLQVAVQNGAIIGFACLYFQDDPVFGTLLDNLHVSKDLHRSGIGKMLMKACAAAIYAHCDSKKMYLWVYDLNENARKAYDKLGGHPFEMIEKTNVDQTRAKSWRYVWNDVAILL